MEKIIVSVDKELSPIKFKNLFYSIVALNFTWMIFHFTVVFFFTLKLESVALVWVFLWLWNLFAFFIDIPIWIIQNYFKAKTLYTIAAISQIIAILIFANFIFQVTDFLAESISDNVWVLKSTLSFFLWNWLNIFLMIIASFCYWLTKELQDITIISYILNNSSPNQYAATFAKTNIAWWLWALFWLLVSWVILSFAPTMIIFTVLLIIMYIIYFTSHFFDNSESTIDFKDIYKFKVLFDKNNYENIWENIKDRVVKTVNKVELINIMEKTKYLFIKPTSLKKWLTFSFLVNETKKTFLLTYNVISKQNSNLLIYWAIIMLLTFWFRDTFASTFLINYLDKVWKWWSYILLWIIAIPAFWLQWFFWKMAEKYWNYSVANVWLFLSWISLFLMWFLSNSSPFVIMFFALINSVWYASCMWLSQAAFLESYNKSYAEYENLDEIDANAWAAPIKILQNFANVFWLVFWWFILAIFNYIWFFIVFWLFILWFLYWSLSNKKKIKK